MRAVLTAPIRLYQRAISPLMGRHCKYHPTCSAYAVQAMRDVAGAGWPANVSLRALQTSFIAPIGSGKVDVVVKAGETLGLCPQGCFMTFPNGDKEALSGGETIEILDGVGRIQD